MSNKEKNKLVVVGDGCCGKTSLLHVYLTNIFPEHYVPTTCDNYIKEIKISNTTNETATFDIWDTAGQEDYDRIRKLSYFAATGIIICFAIDDPVSLGNVQKLWAPEVKKTGVPYILVGTKTDLRNDNENIVSYVTGAKISKKIKARAYVECSALASQGVNEVFETAAKATFTQRTSCVIL